jgi:hypothetical protein
MSKDGMLIALAMSVVYLMILTGFVALLIGGGTC